MKKPSILFTLLTGALSLVSAQAGVEYSSSGGAAMAQAAAPMNVPTLCECFREHTASVSIYGAGLLPDSGDNGELDDALGGGFALDYFFSTHVGIQADATWVATDSAVHLFTASLVLRLPIESACLAPFVFGGGGVHTDGTTQGVTHVGAGLDWRFANCMGLFADARYTWAEDSQDYTLIRGGLRIGF